MKVPIGIIAALIAHVFIAMRLVIIALSVNVITYRSIPIILIVLGLHIVGIVALLLKKAWSWRYTLVLFGFFMAMHFFAITKQFKQFDIVMAVWSGIAFGVSFFVFQQFYTEPQIKKYLNK